jgi:RNA 2',3'-cyclic 3'-phosphodiesterase
MGPGELEKEDPRSLRVRAFFGLPVPDSQRAELAPFIGTCADIAPEFRWTPAENLHLTIRFIGSVSRTVVEGIAGELAGSLPASFDVELGDVGTFGRGRAGRVVWLGLRAGAAEAALVAARVEEECVRAGLPSEERAFTAHLTLARARPRGGAGLPELPPTPHLQPWRAAQLFLYSSHLSRSGALYEPLRSIDLK